MTDAILAGFVTHMCVSSVERGALNLGFQPTVVTAVTATRDLPNAGGGVVSVAALYVASLAGMRDQFAVVVRHAGRSRLLAPKAVGFCRNGAQL